MANQFLDAKEYANVMLLLLKNNLVMGKLVDGKFKNKVTDHNGLTIHVKRPPQFIAKDGPALALQSIVTGSTALQVNRYRNVHISVTDLEYVRHYNELMRSETVKSAASTLAHDVDLYLHGLLLDFASRVGDFAQVVKSPQEFNPVHTRLMDQSVPDTDLNAVCTYADGEKIRGNLIGTNISGVNRTALERTRIPVLSTINLYATQHVKSLTVGSRAASSAAQVDGAGQNVNYVDVKDADFSTILLKSAGNALTVKRGELLTIAGVMAINNRSGEVLPYSRQFVVVEDAVSTAGGALTLKIWPHIIVPGTGGGEADTNTAFATVSAAPGDSAAVTYLGGANETELVRAAWHKQAIQLVSARLPTPFSDTSSFASDPETGISIRYWRGSDINTGNHIHRWDMIYGGKTVDPRLGARFAGEAPPLQ